MIDISDIIIEITNLVPVYIIATLALIIVIIISDYLDFNIGLTIVLIFLIFFGAFAFGINLSVKDYENENNILIERIEKEYGFKLNEKTANYILREGKDSEIMSFTVEDKEGKIFQSYAILRDYKLTFYNYNEETKEYVPIK